jgi:DNA polymerase III delta prime subunit
MNINMYINIHDKIKKKIDKLIAINNIPHIIFHGQSGSGKRYMLEYLLAKVYDNILQEDKPKYLMYVNCAHSKGIKFIRDELIFFAKTNTINNKYNFKSIILFNSDKLTIDAQSALRRCIEKFSYNTRFFIVIENYNRLLNPILSRFSSIYVPVPIIDKKEKTLYDHNMGEINNTYDGIFKKRTRWLIKELNNTNNFKSIKDVIKFVDVLYNRAYSANDIINIINKSNKYDKEKFKIILYFDNIKREFKNEKLLLLQLLTTLFCV